MQELGAINVFKGTILSLSGEEAQLLTQTHCLACGQRKKTRNFSLLPEAVVSVPVSVPVSADLPLIGGGSANAP